jgi:UDP-N-acetylmuramoyl-tripeptide--D-alanyl-D-alanine ligase
VVVSGSPDATVTSWAFDSRVVEAGACFVALRGERDGHEFVEAAFAAGARVALVSAASPDIDAPPGAAVVRVDDALTGLQEVARAVRAERADLVVVGVAGSTGKTSTKDLLAAVLAPLGAYASPESYNNEFGLPITLLNAPADARIVIAEMGERFPDDLAKLCEIARPGIGLVTNVGLAHAEHLGGAPGAAKAMGELLRSLLPGGLAVLNADDDFTASLTAGHEGEVVTVGTAAHAEYRIEHIELDEDLHPSFSLRGRRVTVPLHGEHHAINAAFALAIAHRVFDVDLDAGAAALRDVRPARWRLEIHTTAGGVRVLNDAYNANPASMEAAVRALAGVATAGRRIAVLGDMRELGVHSDAAHEALGRRLGELGIDVLIGVGAGGRTIAGTAEPAVPEVHRAADAEDALRLVREIASRGDTVLVKASRDVGLDVVGTGLLGATS